MEELENRLRQIENRNALVEGNKAWETSLIRRLSVASLTYVTVVVYHLIIGAHNVFVISLVPVMGYLLSTLSLQFIRKRFEKKEEN